MLSALQRAEWLDNYNDDARRQVIAETRALYNQNADLIAEKLSSGEQRAFLRLHVFRIPQLHLAQQEGVDGVPPSARK